MRVLAVAAVLALLAAAACGARANPLAPAPGGDVPVTQERLSGARLVSVGAGPPVTWTFAGDASFVVRASEGALPRDVVEPLLGPGAAAERIEGTWRVDPSAERLVLTGLHAPGRGASETSAALPLRPAGHVRCDLGERQYNVFPQRR